MSRRRTIARRYPVGPFLVVTYRQEPGFWYVTRPNRIGAICRVILTPFRSYGAAVIAAHMLAAQPA